MLMKRDNYGQGWPFQADSVVVECKAATGHIPALSLIVNGKLFQLNADGSTSPQLPASDLVAGRVRSRVDLVSFAQRAQLAC